MVFSVWACSTLSHHWWGESSLYLVLTGTVTARGGMILSMLMNVYCIFFFFGEVWVNFSVLEAAGFG